MRIELSNGFCAGRWHCKNVNKPGCHTKPRPGGRYIECNLYEKKEVKQNE